MITFWLSPVEETRRCVADMRQIFYRQDTMCEICFVCYLESMHTEGHGMRNNS